MTTAREIMTEGAECIGEQESVLEATKKMTELGVGALPICGTDDRLKGVLTDRDSRRQGPRRGEGSRRGEGR